MMKKNRKRQSKGRSLRRDNPLGHIFRIKHHNALSATGISELP
jgi:hypothetical protein